MNCEYECHTIGGPWIAENPNCPVHGTWGNKSRTDLNDAIREILYRVWLRDLSSDEGYDQIESLL